MDQASLAATACAVFVFAGIIKGTVGFGLPTIGLGVMTLFVGVENAMTLILWPAFVSNIWQGFAGGSLRVLVRRLWPFLLAATLSVFAGSFLLTKLPAGYPEIILGLLMISYALPLLAGAKVTLAPELERPAGLVVGLANGVFSGLTGSYTVPGVLYLQALGLARDQLVQAMGLLFLLSTLALGTSLASLSRLEFGQGLLSAAMVIPAMSGVLIGQRIRKAVSEAVFRRLVLAAILGLGLYLLPLGIYRIQ